MIPYSRFLLLVAAASLAPPAYAQEDRLAELEAKVAAQQAQIEQLTALVAQQYKRIEQQLSDHDPAATPLASPAVVIAPPVPVPAGRMKMPAIALSGDVRIRQEWNFRAGRDRSRSVLRGRLRASYSPAPGLIIGAQLATGDPDDPNSTDVTLSNFADDLNISLDQLWIRYQAGGLTLQAGKFPQPFLRTDLVWDADVSPQGAGAIFSRELAGGATLDARGVYFVIDEASTARDSDMLGGQASTAVPLSDRLKLTLAGAYYHYRLGSVAGADAGDFRSNLISNGRYLSKFRLIDGIASLAWTGSDPRWPVIFTADIVHNSAAAVSADTGFSLEIAGGRAKHLGDWRLSYNFAKAEADSVFAAFSHDNLDLATNYLLHGVGLSHMVRDNLLLDLAYYHYRPLDRLYAGTLDPTRWIDRLRLNVMVSF